MWNHLSKGPHMKDTPEAAEHGASSRTAFLAIRELIVMGRLAPGSWIVESDLSNKLGMSRTPIRAALQWLQHEGYVVSRGNGAKSRVSVAPLTLEDARELYAIVGHIEGIAGRLTASLPDKLRKPLVARLKKLNAELAKLAKGAKVPPQRFADVDTVFHNTIVEACAGPRLLAIYNAVKPQTERYWRLYSNSTSDQLASSITEHNQIIDAIAAGDERNAERTLQANWEKGMERLAKMIAHLGERGSW